MIELNLSLRALHLFGAIFWIGGVVTVALVAAAAAKDGQGKTVGAFARSAAVKIAMPGMLAAYAGGVTLLVMGWDGYKRAGWMHTKLLLVIVAAGLTGVLSGKLRKLAAGEEIKPGTLRTLSFALVAITVLVLVMVLLGPLFMGGTGD